MSKIITSRLPFNEESTLTEELFKNDDYQYFTKIQKRVAEKKFGRNLKLSETHKISFKNIK